MEDRFGHPVTAAQPSEEADDSDEDAVVEPLRVSALWPLTSALLGAAGLMFGTLAMFKTDVEAGPVASVAVGRRPRLSRSRDNDEASRPPMCQHPTRRSPGSHISCCTSPRETSADSRSICAEGCPGEARYNDGSLAPILWTACAELAASERAVMRKLAPVKIA
jgi:hypothetical protein